MSILRSLNTGASGIRAHGQALGVTSDNIANSSTIGFKKQRAVFQDVLGRSIGGGGALPQAGAGAKIGHIQQMWTQGALLTTDAPTDLALSGDGFFVVDGNAGGIEGRYFTRAGQFQIDNTGRLTSPDGLRLQGYTANPDGTMGGTLGDLQVAGQTLPANPTTAVDMAMQLDSEATAIAGGFDPLDPENTSNFSSQSTVYDSLGNAHEVTMYYTNTGPGAWDWNALVDGEEVAGGVPGVPTVGASGSLTFDTTGALATETPGPSTWDFVGATAGQAIAFDFGESIADGGTGLEGSTGYASPTTTNGLSQDGFAAGTVAGLSVSADGSVTGVFTNGQRRVLGQVAVADFTSVDGLDRGGNNLFVESPDSGEALIGAASTGGRGSVVSGALEQSNVDLGQEFVDLIGYQRGFQASSRVITTADEMYGELVNLKR